MADLLLNDEEILLKNTVSDYSKNELAVRAAGYDAVSYTHLRAHET